MSYRADRVKLTYLMFTRYVDAIFSDVRYRLSDYVPGALWLWSAMVGDSGFHRPVTEST